MTDTLGSGANSIYGMRHTGKRMNRNSKKQVKYKPFFFISLILFLNLSVFSQSKRISRKQFVNDSINIMRVKLVRPQFRFDTRVVFTPEQKVNISGLDLGVLLKEKLRVTLGYYRLNSASFNNIEKDIGGEIYDLNYSSQYMALNLEFFYLSRRYFSLGMPIEIGVGKNTTSLLPRVEGAEINKRNGVHALSYFGLSGTFKPIRWIGLKGSIGYRKDLFNQVKDVKLDGVYTSIGLAIDFREIIKDIRMYQLKKRYKKNFNAIGTAVDLIVD